METLRFEIAWRAMLKWLRISEENAEEMRREILARYREPFRAYHNLRHALHILQDAKIFAHWWGVEDYGAVQLAALLHDVIYDTRSRENEIRSADFVLQWGRRLDIAPDTCRRAADIILATQDHVPMGGNDVRFVLDADMMVLAAPWDEYNLYRHAIRREYHWVMQADWVAGRGRVLSGFLERECIYHLPAMRDRLEKAARDNIARELSLL